MLDYDAGLLQIIRNETSPVAGVAGVVLLLSGLNSLALEFSLAGDFLLCRFSPCLVSAEVFQ